VRSAESELDASLRLTLRDRLEAEERFDDRIANAVQFELQRVEELVQTGGDDVGESV
jgi:hypothetical protein